jgi:hypothetical protein
MLIFVLVVYACWLMRRRCTDESMQMHLRCLHASQIRSRRSIRRGLLAAGQVPTFVGVPASARRVQLVAYPHSHHCDDILVDGRTCPSFSSSLPGATTLGNGGLSRWQPRGCTSASVLVYRCLKYSPRFINPQRMLADCWAGGMRHLPRGDGPRAIRAGVRPHLPPSLLATMAAREERLPTMHSSSQYCSPNIGKC